METAKAFVAAAIALLGTVGAALEDGRIEGTEIGVIVGAALVAYAAVFATRNRPPTLRH
jgi:hypothetical protein